MLVELWPWCRVLDHCVNHEDERLVLLRLVQRKVERGHTDVRIQQDVWALGKAAGCWFDYIFLQLALHTATHSSPFVFTPSTSYVLLNLDISPTHKSHGQERAAGTGRYHLSTSQTFPKSSWILDWNQPDVYTVSNVSLFWIAAVSEYMRLSVVGRECRELNSTGESTVNVS